jgi:hypothetical protein
VQSRACEAILSCALLPTARFRASAWRGQVAEERIGCSAPQPALLDSSSCPSACQRAPLRLLSDGRPSPTTSAAAAAAAATTTHHHIITTTAASLCSAHARTPASPASAQVERLLQREGADVKSRDPSTGWTALHHAAHYGHRNVAELLVAYYCVTTVYVLKL